MNEQNEFNDQSIKEVDKVIYFSVRQDHLNARDYIKHMESKYGVVFEEETIEVIKTLDFESTFGKVIRVAVIRGEIFDGMRKYPIETLELALELGYEFPNPILACLIFERAMEESKLFEFNFLVTVTPNLVDNEGADIFLAVSGNGDKELIVYYDEPIPGCFVNKLDAYAFSAF